MSPVSNAPAVETLAVDLADPSAVRAALSVWRWDTVVNLAGPVVKPGTVWRQSFEAMSRHLNIAGNLCAAIPAGWDGRLVHVSSMTVYGMPARLPVWETDRRMPIDLYGAAKCFTEDLVASHAGESAVDVWMLRLPGLFSEQRTDGALYHFARAAIERRPLRISAASPVPWEVLHVADAAAAIDHALTSDARGAGAVNVGYGMPMSLNTIAEYIAAKFGRSPDIETVPGVEHPLFCLDITKACDLIDWPPATLHQRLDEFGGRIRAIAVAGAAAH